MNITYFNNYIESHLPTIIESILIVIIGWQVINIVLSIIKKMMLKSKLENIVVTFVNSILNIAFKIILVIIAISHLGVNTASLVTVLATAGAAVVLGLKDSLSGIASGIIILVTKPFKQGDYIKVNNYEGYVTKIEIMDTYLLTRLNETVVIPNNQVTTNTLINYSTKGLRKVSLSFDVHYSSDIAHVKEVIKVVLDQHPLIEKRDDYYIKVTGYKDSSIEITIKVWTAVDHYFNVLEDLTEQVKIAFDKENIQIPYNQMDIHIIENK